MICKARQDTTRQDNATQYDTVCDTIRQYKPRQYQNIQVKARQDKTTQYNIRQFRTIQDNIKQHKTTSGDTI